MVEQAWRALNIIIYYTITRGRTFVLLFSVCLAGKRVADQVLAVV